jgi:3,4-dihydroxy-2-butanone 4-phosphate synthase
MSFEINQVEEAEEDIKQGKIIVVFDDVTLENDDVFIAFNQINEIL